MRKNNTTEGQLTITDYLDARKDRTWGGCTGCACRNCLYWWSMRCPYGKCWDDHRADTDPYDKAHPGEPPRTWWSDWNKPGEQGRKHDVHSGRKSKEGNIVDEFRTGEADGIEVDRR